MSDQNLQGRILAQKYELVRLLGQGGMGAVYEARNHLGKRFAVKLLLKAEFAQDPQLAARFFREAKASAAIESEHIVEVYDTGVDPETHFPFIIMELLKGEDLEHTIARVGPLHPIAAARVISQAANGLGRAHASGIIHRDIKPANIFMTIRDSGDAVVKILDFGIAKHSADMLASNEGAGLTKTGSMLGTPLYMSPEQAQGAKNVDHRSDVWSLCMCLYEALSGVTPWGDIDTLGGLILAICSRDIRPMQDVAPWVPPDLAHVVHAGLARDVNQRIQNCNALIEALRPFTGGMTVITPDILTGVGDAQRGTVAPRASFGASTGGSSSVAGVSSASTTASTSPKKSNGGLIAGVAVVVLLLVGGGIFAATKLGGEPKKSPATDSTDPKPKEAPSPSKDDKPKEDPPKTPSPPPAPKEMTAALTVKVPKGTVLKLGKVDVTSNIVDGKLNLTGAYGDIFIVSVYAPGGSKLLLAQKIFMDDGVLQPDSIDLAKGEQTAKPPTAGTKPSTAPTPGGAAPTGGKPAEPAGTKVKPPIEGSFDG